MQNQVDTIYDVPLNNPQITRHIYLTGGLENTEDYIKTCQALYELDENDVAEIHINSGGGCTEISDMILNAMNKCQAKVKCILESNAHSAASVIFLAADEWEVAPNATMYLHVGFTSAYGEKASDTVPDAIFTENTHFKMIKNAYEGFLTEDEISGLLKGNNIRLDSEEIIERLQRLVEYRQEKMEEAYAETQEDSELQEAVQIRNDGGDIIAVLVGGDILLFDNGLGHNLSLVIDSNVLKTVYTTEVLKRVYKEYLNPEGKVPSKREDLIESIITECEILVNK